VASWFEAYARARVVLEVGPRSPWLSRLLKEQGHDVGVANPRRVRLIAEAERKSDRADAETLARLGRMDPKLLRPIEHRGEEAQKDSALLRVRDALVRSRTRLIQCARGLAKSFGVRLPASSTGRWSAWGEDPQRFAKSRAVGAYLGLTPRQGDSGEARPELSNSKRGDELLRRLLIEAAHYTLGPFGPDSELRRFGLRLLGQGGTRAKKRAVVAVARKLATLLHRLWVTGEAYHALRATSAEVQAA
jgi:transposase